MFFNSTCGIEMLEGSKLDIDYRAEFAFDEIGTSRIEALRNICKNKKIIHVGCLDHIELIEEKLKMNTYLHSIISDVAEKCIGIDINKQGVENIKKQYLISNIVYGDFTKDIPSIIAKEKWDYVILADVLEHISNPEKFLRGISNNCKKGGVCEKFVITVPYAFQYPNFENAIYNLEYINSDHRFWFTPYTLCKVCRDAKWMVEEIAFVDTINLKFRDRIILFLMTGNKEWLKKKESRNSSLFYHTLLIKGTF